MKISANSLGDHLGEYVTVAFYTGDSETSEVHTGTLKSYRATQEETVSISSAYCSTATVKDVIREYVSYEVGIGRTFLEFTDQEAVMIHV